MPHFVLRQIQTVLCQEDAESIKNSTKKKLKKRVDCQKLYSGKASSMFLVISL